MASFSATVLLAGSCSIAVVICEAVKYSCRGGSALSAICSITPISATGLDLNSWLLTSSMARKKDHKRNFHALVATDVKGQAVSIHTAVVATL